MSNQITNNDAISDISQASVKKKLTYKIYIEILLSFSSRALFAYLPLCVFFIVNFPVENPIDPEKEDVFYKNVFLALSYVFIAQVNSSSVKRDAFGNFIYSVKIFFGIICIALFATDKFVLNIYSFYCFFGISLITLFFTVKHTNK